MIFFNLIVCGKALVNKAKFKSIKQCFSIFFKVWKVPMLALEKE